MEQEKIAKARAIDELKFLIEMLTDHDKYGIDYYGIRTHSKYLTNEHCFSPQTQEHLVQALDLAINYIEEIDQIKKERDKAIKMLEKFGMNIDEEPKPFLGGACM